MADPAPLDPHRYLRAQTRWHPIEIVFWVATLLPFYLFPTYLSLASQIAITALFALSLDLILGYAGIVSLGHAAFFGIGAYTAGIISKYGYGDPLFGLVVAALIAGLVGYITSFIISRFKHLALIMITLGLGFLIHEAANSAHWLTGGADGLQGIRIGKLLGYFDFDLWGRTAYSYSLVVLFLIFLLVRRLTNSPFGLALRGIRENSTRMPAIGAPSAAHIRKVYTMSAAIAGIAGALLAQTTSTVSLGVLDFQRSADVLVMLVLGPHVLRLTIVPIAFLCLGVTISEMVMLKVTFPLQMMAAKGAYFILVITSEITGLFGYGSADTEYRFFELTDDTCCLHPVSRGSASPISDEATSGFTVRCGPSFRSRGSQPTAFWPRFCWTPHDVTQGTSLPGCSLLARVGSFHPTGEDAASRRTETGRQGVSLVQIQRPSRFRIGTTNPRCLIVSLLKPAWSICTCCWCRRWTCSRR